MNLWKWSMLKGQRALAPLSTSDVERCNMVASIIPGAYPDEGWVIGDEGALKACLEAAGDKVKWTVPASGKPNPHDFIPAYQHDGIEFMTQRLNEGVLNHDDVGLGKTVQTIGTLVRVPAKVRKVILCPAFLRAQWKAELERWVPKLCGREAIVQCVWPKGDRRSKAKVNPDAEFVIAYYLDNERAMEFVGYNEYILVIDEIHNVRGFKTQRMDSVRALSNFAAGRIGLTASPLYNDPARIHPILDLVSPGAWGSFYVFAKRYAGASDGDFGLEMSTNLTNVDELRKRMAMQSFRRVKEDVAAQMPFDTVYQTVWLDPPSGNLHSVKGAMLGGLEGQAVHMRAVATHKVPAVVEQVQNDRAAGLPGIVFTWLRSQAEAIAAALPDSMLVLGGDGSATRLARIADYVAKCTAFKQVPVIVGTMDALGEGANLQWAKVVNLAALDYTPDKIKQAVGRAARMGQTGTVTVRIFTCRNTIDEHIAQVVTAKLSEQFKLDGRKEKAKSDLNEALSPAGVKDALATMYERMLREETQ